MNKPELITLEGELSRLSTGELIQLKNNPDLLGVWITAALTAAKGAGSIGKRIVKARKIRKRKAKAAKVKKAAKKIALSPVVPATTKTDLPTRAMSLPESQTIPTNKSPIIIIGVAIAALVLIMSQKK